MNIIISLIILGIVGIVVYSMFTAEVDAIWDKIKDQQKEQDKTDDLDPDTVGTSKDKTGGTECDLRLNFVGSATGLPFNQNGLKLWMGSHTTISIVGGIITEKHDPSVVNYTWFNCSDDIDPATGLKAGNWIETLSIMIPYNLNNMYLNSITSANNEYNIWIEVAGTSLNGNGELIGFKNNVKELSFTNRDTIDKGTALPAIFNTEIVILSVPLDDYEIRFSSPQWQINDEIVGKEFRHDVCLPTDPYIPC